MAEDLNIDKTDEVNGILLKNRKDVASGRSGRESRNDFSKAMIRSRYRNTVRNCHSYPGADVNSDHNLVAANLKQVRYKKIKGARKRLKWNLSTFIISE